MRMMDAQSITRNLGGEWRAGYGTAPCPVCQPERRRDQRGLSMAESGGRLLVHCFKSRCGFGDIARALNLPPDRKAPDPQAETALRAKRDAYAAEQLAKARALWDRSVPIVGTAGERYLRSRGITIPLPTSLRFARDLFHGPSGRYACAVVARIEPTGAVHRTFLDKRSAAKLPKSAKMMLGSTQGGAVRLSEGGGPLLVAEGVESALSAAQALGDASVRAWAALSTSGMKSLDLPTAPRELIIAPDADEPGREAAQSLAARAHRIGWRVSILPPPDGCGDWNDAIRMEADHAA